MSAISAETARMRDKLLAAIQLIYEAIQDDDDPPPPPPKREPPRLHLIICNPERAEGD